MVFDMRASGGVSLTMLNNTSLVNYKSRKLTVHLSVDAKMHRTQQDWFYSNPVQYLSSVFPYPPSQLHDISYASFSKTYPSHIILFGELLSRRGIVSETVLETGESQPVITTREGDVTGELESLGYQEVWNGWNGFDWAQDEEERKGGVRVWRVA